MRAFRPPSPHAQPFDTRRQRAQINPVRRSGQLSACSERNHRRPHRGQRRFFSSSSERHLDERFLVPYNAELSRPATDPASAFVTAGGAALDQTLRHEEVRTVGKDNTVVLEGIRLQIAKQPGRATCAGLEVTVRRHLDGTHSVWRGPQCWGRYDSRGRAQQPTERAA